MPASRDNLIHRILAIRLDNLGDVVMTGPALRGLRQAFPQASITLMASPGGSLAAPLLPWVDDVMTWRASWQDISKDADVQPEKEHELVALLQARQFDAAFIFTSFSQSPYPPAYACYLAGIPIRVGQSKEFGGILLSEWIRPLPDSAYQVERSLHLLRNAGLPELAKRKNFRADLELQVPAADQERAAGLLAQRGIPPGQAYLALAPGASAAARRYDEARFEQVARLLVKETGLPLVILGSQREIGRFPRLEALEAQSRRAVQNAPAAGGAASGQAGSPGIISLIGQTSVPEMAAIIQHSALLIANNSGSMHIAAAFHRPMVILFSGTELLEQWAPRTNGVRLLNRPTPCAPCHGFQCPYQMECLDIPPEEVAEHALDLLSKEDPLFNPLQPAYESIPQGGE